MPNRILREGILSSEPVCSLSWAAEVFYRRLMSKVDDHGRFDASPKLLRSGLYPLQIDKVSDADIGKWLTQVVEAGLVSVYPAADGKRYLELLKFGQQVRSKSKYPGPVDVQASAGDGAALERAGNADPPLAPASNCSQVPADAHLGVFVSGDVFGDVSPKPPPGDLFEVFWAAYPRKTGKDAARRAFDKRKPTQALVQQMVRAIEAQRQSEQWRRDGGQYIPNPATWINQGRWMDELPGSEAPGVAGALPWWETRSGIEAMGVELGLGKWDEEREQFFPYRRRVEDAARKAGRPMPPKGGQE